MAYQLRDQQGASRFVAYLALAGAPLIFVTGVVLPSSRTAAGSLAIALVCLSLIAAGLICLRRPGRVPQPLWLIAPFLGTGLVTALNVVSHDDTTGALIFYLWPVLYSANFLSRRNINLTLTVISAGIAGTVFPLDPFRQAFAGWASLTVAFSLTAIVVANLRDRNERLRDVLETQALTDPLTGVANRRAFDGELARAVGRAHRTGDPLTLLTLDIDHFKNINDTYGHGAGDLALRVVADVLRTVARRGDDVVGRLGGDEFVLLRRGDRDTAMSAADEVRTRISAVTTLPGGPPGLSIGIAVLPDHAGSAEELITASDAALYLAKAGGRGRTAWPGPRLPTGNLLSEAG